jgi:hypothetical protein
MQRMGRRVARRLDGRFGEDIPRQPTTAAAEDMILTRQ